MHYYFYIAVWNNSPLSLPSMEKRGTLWKLKKKTSFHYLLLTWGILYICVLSEQLIKVRSSFKQNTTGKKISNRLDINCTAGTKWEYGLKNNMQLFKSEEKG